MWVQRHILLNESFDFSEVWEISDIIDNQYFFRAIAFEEKSNKIEFLQVGLFYAGSVRKVELFYAVFEIRWGYFTPFSKTAGGTLRRFGNVVGLFILTNN